MTPLSDSRKRKSNSERLTLSEQSRSPKSYELEIARLEKALSDECANSFRIAEDLREAQDARAKAEHDLAMLRAERDFRSGHTVGRSDPVSFTFRTDTPPSGPPPSGDC